MSQAKYYLVPKWNVWPADGAEPHFLPERMVRAEDYDALLAEVEQLRQTTSMRVSPAARDVMVERRRQVAEENFTREDDLHHTGGALAVAAAAYALSSTGGPAAMGLAANLWPWAPEWWKPTTPRRDLVKAGALILAEIERLDRTYWS